MSIIRREIRQISDENRGQPIISQAVIHGNVAYFAGITPNPIVGDIKTQTAEVLRRVDELLNLAGTDKSQLLSAQVWIANMRLFEDHNSVWNEWVDPENPPARACLTTDFWRPGMLVEVMGTSNNVRGHKFGLGPVFDCLPGFFFRPLLRLEHFRRLHRLHAAASRSSVTRRRMF